MSSLQHTFHGKANNPFIYSNSLGNRGNDNNNNANRKSKNNHDKKSKRNAKYRAVQGQETTPNSYSYYQQEYPEQECEEGEEELEQYGNKSSNSNTAIRRTALPLLDVNSIHTMIDRANLWLHENKNTFINFSPACVMSSMLFRYNCQNYTAKSLLETLNHKPYIDMDSTAR